MTDPLDRVVSIHDIQQLAYRYAATADRGDAQGFASLFAETEAPKPDPYVDIHAVRQRIAHGLTAAGREQMLFVGNHLIDFDRDDEAHGTVYCLAQIQFGDDFVDQWIVYEDRYVRLDGRWLFLNRRHLLWYGATRSPNPLRQRPADWPRGQVGYGVATAERRASPA